MKTRLILAVVLVAAIAAGYLVWHWGRQAPPAEIAAAPGPAPAETPAATPPAVRFPVEPSAQAEALPALDASDAAFGAALAPLLGMKALPSFIYPDDMIRRFVVTIDNLPRGRVASRLRPVAPVPGAFPVSGAQDEWVIAPANAARYRVYLDLLQQVDAERVVDLYLRFYPLFQQAYQELGYPEGYFNDRFVEAIDDLLAAPELSAPVRLTRPNVLYQFADPELEALSAGQKIMIRMGAPEAARAKAVLREIRGTLVSRAQANVGR